MIESDLAGRDIVDARVLAAMGAVPRERFAPPDLVAQAYDDGPLPIGHGQTISQPYVVALMTQSLALTGVERVLELGTGCGYQTAVLAECARAVYSLEIVEPLAVAAGARLAELGYANVHVRCADGYGGWPDEAPFDAVLAAAAPDHVPEPLVDQLAEGGRLILPVGGQEQELVVIRKSGGELTRRSVLPVRFVPMTGEARK
jgi:protein-L-isoaspartate(D-aspartate) O-methyltransferase